MTPAQHTHTHTCIYKYRVSQSVSQHEASVKACTMCLWREEGEEMDGASQQGSWRIAAPSDPLCLTKETKDALFLFYIWYYCVLTLQFVQVNHPHVDNLWRRSQCTTACNNLSSSEWHPCGQFQCFYDFKHEHGPSLAFKSNKVSWQFVKKSWDTSVTMFWGCATFLWLNETLFINHAGRRSRVCGGRTASISHRRVQILVCGSVWERYFHYVKQLGFPLYEVSERSWFQLHANKKISSWITDEI